MEGDLPGRCVRFNLGGRVAAARAHRPAPVCVGKCGRGDRFLSDQQLWRLGGLAFVSPDMEGLGAMLRRSHSVFRAHTWQLNYFFQQFSSELTNTGDVRTWLKHAADTGELKVLLGDNYENLFVSAVRN